MNNCSLYSTPSSLSSPLYSTPLSFSSPSSPFFHCLFSSSLLPPPTSVSLSHSPLFTVLQRYWCDLAFWKRYWDNENRLHCNWSPHLWLAGCYRSKHVHYITHIHVHVLRSQVYILVGFLGGSYCKCLVINLASSKLPCLYFGICNSAKLSCFGSSVGRALVYVYMRKGLGIFLENCEKPAATRDWTRGLRL